MANNNEHLNRLIEQIYEGVLTDDGWTEALRSICIATDTPQASIVVLDRQKNLAAINEQFDTPKETVAAYNAYYHQHDPGISVAERLPCGSWYHDRRDIGHLIAHSEFYQDFVYRSDVATIVANRLLEEGPLVAYLAMQRRLGQPLYSDAELEACSRFIPHVQRAVHIRMRMQHLAERAGLSSLVLDRLHIPLLVLDDLGRVLMANAEAEAVMRRKPLLAVQQGRLQLKGSPSCKLDQLLQAACGADSPAVAGGMQLIDGQGQPTLQLLVLPLPARLHVFNVWARPLALVMVHDPDQPQNVQEHLLQQVYGLTSAEARVALAVRDGAKPAQVAQQAGVSITTVRTQLRSIFAKMGVARQADLVRMLAPLLVVDGSR